MNSEEQALKYRRLYQLAESMGDVETMDKIRVRVGNILPQWDKQRAAQEAASADFGPVAGPVLVGAGKKLTDWGGGLAKGWDWLTGDESGMAEQDRKRMEREAEFASLRAESPIAANVGEMLPSFVLPGATGKGLLTRALQSGGVSAADEYVASGGELGNALVAGGFGAVGNELGRMASRAVVGSPIENVIPGERSGQVHKAQVKRAKELGLDLTPANQRDLPQLYQVEAGLSRDPFTSGPFLDMEVKNQNVANRIARKAIGLGGSDKIDDYALDVRHKELGDKFKSALGNGYIPLTDDFLTKLDEVNSVYERGLLRDPKLTGLIENFKKIADDQYISVDAYQQYASDLAKLARQTDDGGMQRALYDIRDGLDYEFNKEFGKMPELQEARDQWRNLKDIERSKALSSGDFRPSIFYNYARNRGGRVKPDSDLNDLSIASHYFRNPVPNSGTPTGQAIQSTIDASPGARAIRMLGDPISRAYMATGGRFNIPSAVGAQLPRPLPDIADILTPRFGREAMEPYLEDRF